MLLVRASDFRIFVRRVPPAHGLGMFQLAPDQVFFKVVLRLARFLVDLSRANEPLLRLVIFSRCGSIAFAFVSLAS